MYLFSFEQYMAARGLPKHLRVPWAAGGLHVSVERPRRRRYAVYRAAVWPRQIRAALRRAAEEERERREYWEQRRRENEAQAERRRREHVEQLARAMAEQRPTPPADEIERWLGWNNGTVRILADVIRDHWQGDLFPILADALEDAGCSDADVLNPCRHGGPEVVCRWILQVLGTNGNRAEPVAAPDPTA